MTPDPVLDTLDRIEALLKLGGQQRTLLTKDAAAVSMGLSLSSFERYVKPEVPFVLIGTKKLYRPGDLERWAGARVQDFTARRDRPR